MQLLQRSSVLLLIGALALGAVWPRAGLAEGFDTPNAVIEKTAESLAGKLEGRQAYFADNLPELYTLVDELLLPGFDVDYASKLVLGRTHWTGATEAQRAQFVEAFYGFLVRTYAKGLIGFDQKAMSVDSKPRYSKEGDKALVRTRLALEGGDDVQINYALRNTDDGWKMYDVRIDGVSYVQNYRSQFDAEITAKGIDAVIERLISEGEEAARAAEEA